MPEKTTAADPATQELTAESPCPGCGEQGLWRESVDVGVGIIYGPFGCPCGWSECSEYDSSESTPEAPDGWRATPQGVLVNLDREAEELDAMKQVISDRFGITFDGGSGS